MRLASVYSVPRVVFVAALALAAPSRSVAQPPPPVPPNPQAPTLNLPVPLGMQRGTALDLTLTGANLANPTAVLVSFPAKVTIPTDNNNGKNPGSLRVRLEVPKDAPLGTHTLRLATTKGMSNFRPFCLDDLPPVREVDTNRNKATPQAVPIPCVVIGRSDAEVSDYYKVNVAAGQRLSFEIIGRRLGSQLDPQITLIHAKTGRELIDGHNNDAPGCQTDSRLTYTFKEAGEYLVEVRDTLYRGGGDFYYRLRIGDFPCATTPIPMAAKRGTKATLTFAGPLVEGVSAETVSVPTDPTVDTVWVAPRGANGLYGTPVALAVSDFDEVVEQEPNNEQGKANRVPVPGGITARFLVKGEPDLFVFPAKKGQRLIVEAHTLELYSPTEVYLVLKDAKGGQLAASNPAAAPRIDFTAKADGDYFLTVEHLLNWGGPAESYRVTVTPHAPDFDLNLGIDRYDIPPGGTAVVPIQTVTRRDYPGPIEVSVAGHPGISGQLVIPAGAAAVPNQPVARLFLTAKPDVPPGAYPLRVVGKATINGKPVVSYGSVRQVISTNLGGLPFPPRELNYQVALAVTEKPPFTLAAKFDHAEAVRGLPAPLTITATRAAGFAEEIALAPVGLPANVAPALKNIPKGMNAIKVQLNPAANAALGQFPISFTGTSKQKNAAYTVLAAPVNLVLALPFDLKVEPATVKIAQGGKVKLKVTATRKGGYQGPIAVELRNLPANVTAPKATIAQGQNAVEIELTAAANAAVGNKGDVNVLGTASAAANQQNASPNFAVNVAKK